MKIKLLLFILFFAGFNFEVNAQDNKQNQITTFYLIRHAEKDRSDPKNRNPHLTVDGKERAEKWAKVFEKIALDTVISTPFNRTLETAQPTATIKNLKIGSYDPFKLDGKEFLKNYKGKKVLVVGHSNTTPMLANKLLEREIYEIIPDDQNGYLFIITLGNNIAEHQILVIN